MNNENDTTEQGTDGAELGKRLKAAGKKAEKAKTERRARQVKGAHLTTQLTDLATAAGLRNEAKTGFAKITGESGKGPAIYVANKGGRVDLSGFTVEAPAFRQITEQEARDRHLGKVRAQINFECSDEEILSAFSAALQVVSAWAPPVKATRPAKVAAQEPADEAAQAAG